MGSMNSNNIVYITLLCVVLCFEWSVQEKLHLHIPLSDVKVFREQAQVCSKETGVPAEYLKKIIEKTLSDERVNKEFFYCVVSNTGFVDNNGQFNADRLLSLEIKSGTEDDVKNTVKECNNISKDDKIETSYAISDCIHNIYHFSV